MGHVQKSEDNLQDQFSPSMMWTLEIEHMSSGLLASAFICWDTLPDPKLNFKKKTKQNEKS